MDGETVSPADGLHFAAQIKGYTRFSLKPVIDFRRTLDQLCSGSAAGGEMIRGGGTPSWTVQPVRGDALPLHPNKNVAPL